MVLICLIFCARNNERMWVWDCDSTQSILIFVCKHCHVDYDGHVCLLYQANNRPFCGILYLKVRIIKQNHLKFAYFEGKL